MIPLFVGGINGIKQRIMKLYGEVKDLFLFFCYGGYRLF